MMSNDNDQIYLCHIEKVKFGLSFSQSAQKKLVTITTMPQAFV